ncbi:carbon-nitrogen family hydrolase [Halalkalibacter urbisdiaboli]|uniref:carbon-nitrogen family hydrolase n=1 Tax=Halalkalibacter urbisdiaboli TaxID=1960589 RepID=UPI000B42F972|nr:carbon-nitrogen family hydrolase [Halalkalibacter urbisdiaboli]
MIVAMYQMNIVPGDPEANKEKVEKWVETICHSNEKPDILVLPEMWTTAYTLSELNVLLKAEGDEIEDFLSQLAKTYEVNMVAGSIAKREKSTIFNRALVYNRKGELVYKYDKIHLVPMLDEHLFLTGGQEKVTTFELDGHKMGAVICYDLRFPELARQLALEGAEVLFILAEWPEARATHWEILQQARAIENQFYTVSCNRVGTYDGVEFAGRSMMTNPWGEVLAKGSQSAEESVVASLDLSQVEKIREDVPVFKSRVPHLYK